MKTQTKVSKAKTKANYDPIQERAQDRDVTRAEKKAKEQPTMSQRQQIEKQMADNDAWISQNGDDTEGVQQRRAANAELTHKLIDLDVASREAGRTADRLKA